MKMADKEFFETTDNKIRPTEPAPDSETGKGKRGRRKKVDIERDKLEQQKAENLLQEEKLQGFKSPVKTGLRVLFNDAILTRFPEDAKMPPLSDAELDALADSLLPVLDELGWLDKAGNPYLTLTLVSFGVFYPRFAIYMEYKKQKSGQLAEPDKKRVPPVNEQPDILKKEKDEQPQQKRTTAKRTRKP